MKNDASTEWHPIAHVTVEDAACRAAIVDTLHRRGWSVIEQPTGLHLIRAISGIILGDKPWLRPGLIVADAAARGCSGLSIARGLRDLGSRIPVVVVARAADELAPTRDGPLTIVAPDAAARTVELLARPRGSRRGNPSLGRGRRPARVSYGDVLSSVPLSETIDQAKIDAKLTDGVLRLELPKVEKARPRQISVRTG